MLNKLWLGFFLTAAAAALYRWLAIGDPDVFRAMVASLFDMARVSVEGKMMSVPVRMGA
ncbi:hypothetical protein [Lactiplantibacillus plantarum]|uniref:hypothetical protein n=1 Tax=Lactiplantibacillus plantarum TaxID=1590 RepID=UPI004045E98F